LLQMPRNQITHLRWDIKGASTYERGLDPLVYKMVQNLGTFDEVTTTAVAFRLSEHVAET
jgi:hypothetical protein